MFSKRKTLMEQLVSEQKALHQAINRLSSTYTRAMVQQLKWTGGEENTQLFYLYRKLAEVNWIHNEMMRQLAEKHMDFTSVYQNIYEEERIVEDAKKVLQAYDAKMVKLQKQLDTARKKGDSKICSLEIELSTQRSQYDHIAASVKDKSEKLELYKIECIKKGLLSQTEGVLTYSRNLQALFLAQSQLVELLPSKPHPHSPRQEEPGPYSAERQMDKVMIRVSDTLGIHPPTDGGIDTRKLSVSSPGYASSHWSMSDMTSANHHHPNGSAGGILFESPKEKRNSGVRGSCKERPTAGVQLGSPQTRKRLDSVVSILQRPLPQEPDGSSSSNNKMWNKANSHHRSYEKLNDDSSVGSDGGTATSSASGFDVMRKRTASVPHSILSLPLRKAASITMCPSEEELIVKRKKHLSVVSLDECNEAIILEEGDKRGSLVWLGGTPFTSSEDVWEEGGDQQSTRILLEPAARVAHKEEGERAAEGEGEGGGEEEEGGGRGDGDDDNEDDDPDYANPIDAIQTYQGKGRGEGEGRERMGSGQDLVDAQEENDEDEPTYSTIEEVGMRWLEAQGVCLSPNSRPGALPTNNRPGGAAFAIIPQIEGAGGVNEGEEGEEEEEEEDPYSRPFDTVIGNAAPLRVTPDSTWKDLNISPLPWKRAFSPMSPMEHPLPPHISHSSYSSSDSLPPLTTTMMNAHSISPTSTNTNSNKHTSVPTPQANGVVLLPLPSASEAAANGEKGGAASSSALGKSKAAQLLPQPPLSPQLDTREGPGHVCPCSTVNKKGGGGTCRSSLFQIMKGKSKSVEDIFTRGRSKSEGEILDVVQPSSISSTKGTKTGPLDDPHTATHDSTSSSSSSSSGKWHMWVRHHRSLRCSDLKHSHGGCLRDNKRRPREGGESLGSSSMPGSPSFSTSRLQKQQQQQQQRLQQQLAPEANTKESSRQHPKQAKVKKQRNGSGAPAQVIT